MSDRDVQLALLEGMARPVGPLLDSVVAGSNADLMLAAAPLYLRGSVLDVTYGRGKWWDRYQPDKFDFHDLALDGVDFRALPEDDDSYDTVIFDPPYVHSSGQSSSKSNDFTSRYGLEPEWRYTCADIRNLMTDGTRECCRVARSYVLVKAMGYVQNHVLTDLPALATNAAADVGWAKWDVVVHHSGPSLGNGRPVFRQKRARRAHSYLLVFASPDKHRYRQQETT